MSSSAEESGNRCSMGWEGPGARLTLPMQPTGTATQIVRSPRPNFMPASFTRLPIRILRPSDLGRGDFAQHDPAAVSQVRTAARDLEGFGVAAGRDEKEADNGLS